MDDDYYDSQQSFTYQLIGSNLTTTSIISPPEHDHDRTSKINFKFSFEFQVNQWILGECDEDESELVSQTSDPIVDYLVSVSFDQFFSAEEETRKYMQEQLCGLRVDSEQDRLNLVKNALHEARKSIEECCDSYPMGGGAHHRVLDLHFNVLLEHEYFYLDDREIIPIICNMVPAKDSSIDKVLKKIPEYSRRNTDCSICLESLFSGTEDCNYDREAALSMPCSHVFHGDCIKNWLRVSHYCPLCRFEMPTDD